MPDRPAPETTKTPATATPMAFARVVAAAYPLYHQSPASALKLAQITPAVRQQPDGRITARQMEMLSGTAMQELDDEAPGAYSRRLPWSSYGMLARASLSAPNLGVAPTAFRARHGA